MKPHFLWLAVVFTLSGVEIGLARWFQPYLVSYGVLAGVALAAVICATIALLDDHL